MTITRYCQCGASMQVRSTPPDLAERLAGQFDVRHRGEGHAPTTPAKAARARRRDHLALIPREDTPVTRCTPTCIPPRPTNAHCSVCHRTFGTVTSFDRHRRGGECLDPTGLRMHPDPRGVWRMDGDAASAFSREPRTAETVSVVPASTPEPSEPAETISGGWGDYPLTETYPGSGTYE